jgi:urease accessory protein
MMRSIFICLAFTVALVSPALAHTGLGNTSSFASGIAHPIHGADHILAMVAIGLWAALAGGRAIWAWPTAFIAMMPTGFATATFGLQVPFVEFAIWSSTVILALFVALAVKAPVSLGAAVAGVFGVFHGYTHGVEVGAASLIPYAAGFSLATLGLHATGIALGLFAKTALEKIALGDASGTEARRCSR